MRFEMRRMTAGLLLAALFALAGESRAASTRLVRYYDPYADRYFYRTVVVEELPVVRSATVPVSPFTGSYGAPVVSPYQYNRYSDPRPYYDGYYIRPRFTGTGPALLGGSNLLYGISER